jgi:hypothetical protein
MDRINGFLRQAGAKSGAKATIEETRRQMREIVQ